MINMRRLMFDRDLRVRFTRQRPTVGLAHVGEAALTYPEEVDLFGIVQPPTEEDMKLTPDGTRVDAVRVFWSTEELRIGDGQNYEADVLVYKGENFRVTGKADRDDNGFYRVVAVGFNP